MKSLLAFVVVRVAECQAGARSGGNGDHTQQLLLRGKASGSFEHMTVCIALHYLS